MSLTIEQKKYLLLGEFTQKYIQYETIFSEYRTLSTRLPNIKPTSLHFYNEWGNGKCVTKHRDNFVIIDDIFSQLNRMLDEMTVLDKRILKISKEYFKLYGETIPIRSMDIFKNEDSLRYIEKKMEAINGGREEIVGSK